MAKVGVVGVGAVGQACAFALMLRGSAREIVLVDRTTERATAVATDMRYGAPLSPTAEIVGGEWADLAGAGVVLICAVANEKSALPTVVGHEGAAGAVEPSMSDEERRAFERSAETLKDAARSIGVG